MDWPRARPGGRASAGKPGYRAVHTQVVLLQLLICQRPGGSALTFPEAAPYCGCWGDSTELSTPQGKAWDAGCVHMATQHTPGLLLLHTGTYQEPRWKSHGGAWTRGCLWPGGTGSCTAPLQAAPGSCYLSTCWSGTGWSSIYTWQDPSASIQEGHGGLGWLWHPRATP